MIAIIDYNLGNVKSIQNACRRIGQEAVLTRDAAAIEAAHGIILPGVGSFNVAMHNLEQYNLIEPLNKCRQKGTPILGICLGMQILFETGYENGKTRGLGWLEGRVKMIPTDAPLPHMGWNTLSCSGDDMYFVHSFMADYNDTTIECTEYGGIKIPAVVGRDNVLGVQFHPEKSGKAGENFLRDWMRQLQKCFVIPAIDLKDGRAVRLLRGDYAQKTVYSGEPAEIAAGFERAGANYLHVVDLDGAKDGNTANLQTIKKIRDRIKIPIQVGGGIRTEETAALYLDTIGASRVILGTAAIKNFALVRTLIDRFGADRVAVGVDVRDGKVATGGWQSDSGIDYLEFVERLRAAGVKIIIVTDISRDGTLSGPNWQMYDQIKGMNIIVSGGVGCIEDIRRAGKYYGVIVGKAYYEGKIDIAEALKC